MADLLVFPRQGESLKHGSGFSKNLNKPGLPNRKGWLQKSSCQGCQSCLCQKEENGATSLDHQIVRWERVKVSESHTFLK